MTATNTLIDRYMKELKRELGAFPHSRRQEILDEVSEHIAEARSELDSENDAAIRNVLDRLGQPSEIASAARDRFGIRSYKAGVLEGVAAVALVVPFLGWIGGLILVWMSRVWTLRDKVIASLVPALPLAVIVLSIATESGSVTIESGSNRPNSPLRPMPEESFLDGLGNFIGAWVVPIAFIVLPLITAIYLTVRARNLSDAAE